MKITYTKDPLLHKVELRRTPVIIRVNKFDEKSARSHSPHIAQKKNSIRIDKSCHVLILQVEKGEK